MKQLHNTVSRVRSSLDLVNVVSEKKIYNYLNDNKTLLLEVNNLRTEVNMELLTSLLLYFQRQLRFEQYH